MQSKLLVLITALILSVGSAATANGTDNQLTSAEKAAGWKLLFDGKTTEGWRSFKKQSFPERGWAVEDGTLHLSKGSGGGDIITKQEFTDFELEWDWKIEPGGNNGVKYLITEERSSAIGHEYQMVNDPNTGPKHETASFYDVLPPKMPVPQKPPGEWNHSRILLQGNHVEHWLNGEKVLTYELGSSEVKAAVAKSKFKDVKGFGEKLKGHILLTEHHDAAWYKNIKIRELKSK